MRGSIGNDFSIGDENNARGDLGYKLHIMRCQNNSATLRCFLFKSRDECTLRAVIQLRAGLFFYKQDTALENVIVSAAQPPDDGDINTAWLLYQNQELCVFGPNNMHLGINQT